MQSSPYALSGARLSELLRQLSEAERKYALASKELKSAERKEERAGEAVRALREEIAMEKLRQWGDGPDLAEIMAAGNDKPMVFYQALEALAERFGFTIFGYMADTMQTSINISLNRREIGGIERVKAGVMFFAPAMETIRGGWIRFNVSTHEENCAWSLRYSKRRGNAELVRHVHCIEDMILPFPSLDAALQYIEANLWADDVVDAEATTLLPE